MNNFWFITGDFLKTRSNRIGSSDIPALIPNPEHPTDSLAGYGRTALTVWEEKTGRRKRDPAGFPAEMGHWNEPKAIELFMRPVFGEGIATEWLFRRMQYEILKMRDIDIDPRQYQEGTVLHSTQYYTDDMICHADGIYKPIDATRKGKIKAHNLIIDTDEPFLIEAKSTRYWAARRPEESLVTGYDTELNTWQGIPLKHYWQIQFQLALLDVEVCCLPLIADTSDFHVWEIRANRKRQNAVIDLAGRLAYYIKHDIPPKELAMNLDDIKRLYPVIQEDFAYIEGEEREKAIEHAAAYRKAAAQEKIWSDKKKEAADSLAVMMKDRGELKDEYGSIAKWTTRKSSEKLQAFSELKKDELVYRYLKRKGKIEPPGEPSRYVTVTMKEGERE